MDVLFALPFAERGEPLFSNKSDLAREVNKRGPFRKKKLPSVRNYIYQVLAGARPVSTDLREAIFAAAEERVADEDRIDEVHELLKEALALQNRTKREVASASDSERRRYIDHETVFASLAKAGEEARVRLIISHRPSEIIDSKHSDNLKNQLVETVSEFLEHGGSTGSRFSLYSFYVPSIKVAKRFWQKLFEFLVYAREMQSSEAMEFLKRINTEALRVYIVDPVLCSKPTAIFDPEGDAKGFVLFYHSEERIHAAEMSPTDVDFWKEYEFPLLDPLNPDSQNGLRQVEWSDELINNPSTIPSYENGHS